MQSILKELSANLHVDSEKKQQIIDAVMATENEDILIGLDISEVLDLFREYKELYIGMVNTRSTTEASQTIDALISSTQTDVTGCSKVYLYIKGDVSLIEVNDVAQTLEYRIGEEAEILFTATYDKSREREYEVIALFLQ